MASLKDVCYEQIKDNYWYGLFGDFRIIIDKETGYFNATKLCKEGGKRFHKWLENKQSKELIDYLEQPNLVVLKNNKIIFKVIGKVATQYNYNGTYVHKDLIVNIACWISPEFSIKVNNIVFDYFINEFNEKYKNDKDKLKKKLNKIENKMKVLKIENAKYKELEEDITPKTVNEGKLHIFMLIKKNKGDSKHPYYAMRTQRLSYKQHLNRLKIRYPNLEVIYEVKYNPNSINLFNRMKEQLKDIDVRFNGIKLLNEYKVEDLKADVKRLSFSF